ncbi:hypothetical protein ACLOJK_021819 [Asimina triloba]
MAPIQARIDGKTAPSIFFLSPFGRQFLRSHLLHRRCRQAPGSSDPGHPSRCPPAPNPAAVSVDGPLSSTAVPVATRIEPILFSSTASVARLARIADDATHLAHDVDRPLSSRYAARRHIGGKSTMAAAAWRVASSPCRRPTKHALISRVRYSAKPSLLQ